MLRLFVADYMVQCKGYNMHNPGIWALCETGAFYFARPGITIKNRLACII